MRRAQPYSIPIARALLSLFWGILCAALLVAPALAAAERPAASSFFYSIFASVCHQDPARSLALCGHPLAVCHRCTGIYFGLLVACWFPFERTGLLAQPERRRAWALCAAAPLLLDAGLQWTGYWASTPATRMATGFLFGSMLSSLLVPALSEILDHLRIGRRNLDSEA